MRPRWKIKDIDDIKIRHTNEALVFMSSVNHSIERYGEIDAPKFRKILPVIFFIGKPSQPTKVEEIRDAKFRTIAELRKLIERTY